MRRKHQKDHRGTTTATIQGLVILFAEATLLLATTTSLLSAVEEGGGPWSIVALVATGVLVATALFARTLRRERGGVGRGEPAHGSVAPSAVADPMSTPPMDDATASPRASATVETAAPAMAAATAGESSPAEGHRARQPSVPVKPQPARSRLDFEALAEHICATDDPLAELKLFVGDIRTRQAMANATSENGMTSEAEDGTRREADATPQSDASPLAEALVAPSELELYAARQLEEAGLFAKDVELPRMRIVRPRTSHMLYLRVASPRLPYLAKVRVIALEAALNALRYATTYFDDPSTVTEADAYKLNQSLLQSVCAQSPNIDEPITHGDSEPSDGEWAVRNAISTAMESAQLPYRLNASFRTNVADGNVSFELSLTPEDAFPASMFVPGLGIVSSSREMRRKAASAYARRVALLLAAFAFRASTKVKHVWVVGTLETARRRWCYFTVDFDRWRFSRLDMAHVDDLARTWRPFVPNIRLENDILRPVEQSVSLSEPRFCPPRRYESVSLSNRRLTGDIARALGTDHVSGLAIEEGDQRSLVAASIMGRLVSAAEPDATQRNVRMIMDVAGDDPDPSVRDAAVRTVRHLVEGTIGSDAPSVGEDFVAGDALSRAVARAKGLLAEKDLPAASELLSRALEPIDRAGLYRDTPTTEWRYFSSYVDRALHNRVFGGDTVLMLVPNAYFEAHLLLSLAQLSQGRKEEALAGARRIVELAPMGARARLHLVKCLEELGRADEAIEELRELLSIAHDPEGLGLAYYRMASFQWQAGNLLAAEACYVCALRFMPSMAPTVSMEMAVLSMRNPGSLRHGLSGTQIVEILRAHDIPVAPTDETAGIVYDCARASLDAEIFPVARNFIGLLGAFTGDDVIMNVIRSIEGEPDR